MNAVSFFGFEKKNSFINGIVKCNVSLKLIISNVYDDRKSEWTNEEISVNLFIEFINTVM